MSDSTPPILEAKATRYNISRLQYGRMLIPIAIFVSIGARAVPNVFTAVLAFGVQGTALYLLLSAAKRFGWQPLVVEQGSVSIGSTGVRLERHKVHEWTMVNGLARLYGVELSYKLRARSGGEEQLSALLERRFGPRTALHR